MERQIAALLREKEGLQGLLSEATRQVDLLNTTDDIPPSSPSHNEGEDEDEHGGARRRPTIYRP